MTAAERRELASQVRARRLELDMTQTDLARAAGVARQTISNLENGMAPQEGNLRAVLAVLGISATSGNYSPDTEMWLGLIGGALEALPPSRRGVAGQSAMNAITVELRDLSSDVAGTADDFGLAARPAEVEPTDES